MLYCSKNICRLGFTVTFLITIPLHTFLPCDVIIKILFCINFKDKFCDGTGLKNSICFFCTKQLIYQWCNEFLSDFDILYEYVVSALEKRSTPSLYYVSINLKWSNNSDSWYQIVSSEKKKKTQQCVYSALRISPNENLGLSPEL